MAGSATLEFAGGTFTLSGGIYSAAGKTLVAAGDLLVDSASGTAMTINGGTLEFALNSPTAVTFSGTTGKLTLDQSQTFTGTIAGLTSSAPGDVVDLKDINFTGATKTYVGTTTSGVLTIKDGVHTANLSMIGDYTPSSFTLQNDGSGHVQFYDPSATQPAAVSYGASAEPSLQSLWAAASSDPLLAIAHHG